MKTLSLTFLLLFSSCSIKSLVIHFVDNYVVEKISESLGLYPKQEKGLEREVREFLNKKETKELARNLTLQIDSFILNPEIDSLFDELVVTYKKTAILITPILLQQFKGLSPKQIKELKIRFDKENQETLVSIENYKAQKLKKSLSSLIGELNQKQNLLIKAYTPKFKARNNFKLIEKQKLQNALIEILEQKKEIDTIQALFKNYEDRIFSNSLDLKNFYREFLITLSSKQTTYLKKKLSEVKLILNLFIEKKY